MKRKKLDRLGTDAELSRYHFYNDHFVCLDCRKMFNQLPLFRRPSYAAKSCKAICPECNSEMKNAGKNFKPPRRNNIKQWRKVEWLLQRGYRWDYTFERRKITEGLSEGADRGWRDSHTFNGPYARTLREAKEDYPIQG